MASNRQQILEALRNRLRVISKASGFATDAGCSVFLNELPPMGPSDPDVAIAIVIGDDQKEYQGVGLLLLLPVEIQALAKVDIDEPWIAAEQVLGDVKTAIELEDRTLGGLVKRQLERGTTRTLPREPGSLTVGAGITYAARYIEAWGQP